MKRSQNVKQSSIERFYRRNEKDSDPTVINTASEIKAQFNTTAATNDVSSSESSDNTDIGIIKEDMVTGSAEKWPDVWSDEQWTDFQQKYEWLDYHKSKLDRKICLSIPSLGVEKTQGLMLSSECSTYSITYNSATRLQQLRSLRKKICAHRLHSSSKGSHDDRQSKIKAVEGKCARANEGILPNHVRFISYCLLRR